MNKLFILLLSLLLVFSLSLLPQLSAKDTHKSRSNGNKGKPGGKDKPKDKPKDRPKKEDKKDKEKKGRLRKFLKPHKEKKDKSNKDKAKGKKLKYEHEWKEDGDKDDNDDLSFLSFMFDIWGEIVFDDQGIRYSSYPYGDPEKLGIYISEDPSLSPVALQFRSYYQPIERGLWSYGMYGKLLMPSGLTFDISVTRYTERVTPSHDEKMNYGEWHFNVDTFGIDTNVVVEVGLGGAWLTDVEGHSHSSLSGQITLDYFPGEPWSLHLGTAYAAPGGSSIYNLEALGGWHHKSFELFLGYHSLLNAGGANLNGPVFGFALWF